MKKNFIVTSIRVLFTAAPKKASRMRDAADTSKPVSLQERSA
ncbi:hypothetical protein MAUB1S_09821 [Mycolicibacterium aubagnense]